MSWPGFRVFRHRDFRLLLIAAFLSFPGAQVQMVAQGAYVFHLNGRTTDLGLVAFFGMIPVTLLSPIMGVVVDLWDRKKILIWVSLLMAALAAWNAATLAFGHGDKPLTLLQILFVACLGGIMQTMEMPSRQTVVREVVGEKDLASAIPLQAMTFNMARIVGPSIGGLLTAAVGYAVCFWINAVSYVGIMFAVLSIKTDLRPATKRVQPIKDLIFEGMLYTFRNQSLKILFVMEGTLSLFGIPYIFQMPAIAKQMFNLDEAGLGMCYTSIGIGAFIGLVTLAGISLKPIKTKLVGSAMGTFAVCLVLLSLVRWTPLAFFLMSVIGSSAIMQFNTTNALFQMLSPDRLRGRVLSMHMWAISGLAPIGNLWMGLAGDQIGLRSTLIIGGILVSAGAVWAFTRRRLLQEPPVNGADPAPEPAK